MPISVVVKDEQGRTLARLEDVYASLPVQPAVITADVLPLGRRETYPLLSYIDPYGDTCFNVAQARAAVTELRDWDQEVQSEASRALLAGLAVLCAAHMSRPHRYLWFVGD
ncbi:hypothetical protein [Actinotalea subterranea]|uniref:hypothetical protein n=1 Tax=Actinotalea subterranea TaxID=2607497 RepID=UPI0011ECB76D|nr:hypothetical protein [Actinotalea subterranea]